jgi:hypothetical protein
MPIYTLNEHRKTVKSFVHAFGTDHGKIAFTASYYFLCDVEPLSAPPHDVNTALITPAEGGGGGGGTIRSSPYVVKYVIRLLSEIPRPC